MSTPLITYEEALEKIDQLSLEPLGIEKVPLMDTLNRILALDIKAQENCPAVPVSALDGFAVQHQDLALGKIKISGDNPAGIDEIPTLTPQTCIKTFTGSAMPHNSDTLIPVENVTVDGEYLIINESVDPNANVRQPGDNFKKGDLLLTKGTRISPTEIGLMASLNMANVPVHIMPTVGIITFGSELVDMGDEITSLSQIRSINNYVLTSSLKSMGITTINYGIIHDDYKTSEAIIHKALQVCDVLITTGGMSKGDYDFVQDIIADVSDNTIFKGVKIKPGKPIMYAQSGKTQIFGLPGYPNSAFVTYTLFAKPVILKLLGLKDTTKYTYKAILKEDAIKPNSRKEFRVCNIYNEGGKFYVDFKGKQSFSSAIFNNFTGDTGLMILNEDQHEMKAGSEVDVVMIKNLFY